MDPKTGEIKEVDNSAEIPVGWKTVPPEGTAVEMTYVRRLPGGAKRTMRSRWVVVNVVHSTPGRLVLEPELGREK